MNKKIIFGTLIALLLSLSLVSAGLVPMQVYGFAEFNGVKYANQKITLHSNVYNYDWVTYTNDNGQFQFVLNNLRTDTLAEITSGQSMYIDICAYDVNSACRIVYIASENPIDITKDITGSTASDLTSSDATVVGDTTTDTTDTVVPDVTTTCGDLTCGSTTCPVGAVCPAVEDPVCPEPEKDNGIWYAIGSALAGLGLGGYFINKKTAMGKGVGLKLYTKNDGTEGVFHKHPGIVGYHEPKTNHRDKNDRHPSGQLAPKYEKNEKGVWVYKE